ncbi:MAG: hypothetical protein KJ600_05645 [Nanoarchaeota archaeon]|nr:hypothetical protein [Nanoarchaeota archaeon]MBU1104012.1 hypothetical protein [Nanoarchaeota archaeon]
MENKVPLGMKDRPKQILNLVPKDVKTVLDIGSVKPSLFSERYKTLTMDYSNADIMMDLNGLQKIPLRSKSINLVVLSQILEHLFEFENLIAEAKRISNKYILVGLPNEFTIDNRIKFLFGVPPSLKGYDKNGHKYLFDIQSAEELIQLFFKGYLKKYFLFGVTGGRYLPLATRRILARFIPGLFAAQIYYLI